MKDLTITSEVRKVLDDFISYGVAVRKDVAMMRESFNERLKEVAESTGIDKKILRKIVKFAYEREIKGDHVLEEEAEVIDLIKDLVLK